ncbi:Cytochrome c oxidase subunit 5A [Linnemannia zychae]|nr:Cytochrome c oxidase subunit 5A [Linnemannia zychae]
MLRNLVRPAVRVTQRRCASTAAVSEVPLTNLELRWKTLSAQEKNSLTKSLEQAQAGDWNKMTLDQKKAAYWVAFGPHGARTPLLGPGHAVKVIAGTAGVLAASAGLYLFIRSKAEKAPKTMTKEWQEATNEYARANKINPFTGVSSENYKGSGFITESK